MAAKFLQDMFLETYSKKLRTMVKYSIVISVLVLVLFVLLLPILKIEKGVFR